MMRRFLLLLGSIMFHKLKHITVMAEIQDLQGKRVLITTGKWANYEGYVQNSTYGKPGSFEVVINTLPNGKKMDLPTYETFSQLSLMALN